MGEWIDVKERLPENKPGKWSNYVIALCDNGEIFKLCCMGHYWQRSRSFVESEAECVTHWMPIPEPKK